MPQSVLKQLALVALCCDPYLGVRVNLMTSSLHVPHNPGITLRKHAERNWPFPVATLPANGQMKYINQCRLCDQYGLLHFLAEADCLSQRMTSYRP